MRWENYLLAMVAKRGRENTHLPVIFGNGNEAGESVSGVEKSRPAWTASLPELEYSVERV